MPILRAQLDALVDGLPRDTRDPVHRVRRYTSAADAEVAAVFAATLAFGRVSAFLPVLDRVLAQADEAGGPAAWVTGFSGSDARRLEPVIYRWIRGPHLATLAAALGRLRVEHGSLEQAFLRGVRAAHADVGPALDGFMRLLREAATQAAEVSQAADLPRGLRHCLPMPSAGSGCKRWNLFLRWMVRRPTCAGDPDLGLWDLPPSKLVIPVDTHVLRIARLVGLTHRSDGSWRTATEITANLARIDPTDPVKYDFALAHLGISQGCRSRYEQSVCAPCPLASCCRYGQRAGRVSRGSGGGA